MNAASGGAKRALLAELLRQKASEPKRYPLSSAQEATWALGDAAAGRSICFAVRLTGPLDTAILERSFQAMVRRHDMLRTVFAVDAAGSPEQIVLRDVRLPLVVTDMSGLPRPERERGVQELVRGEMRRPFDLAEAPLFRTTLIRLGAEEHVLVRNVHRLLADGWSIGLMSLELATFYNAFVAGASPALPQLPIQYGDWVRHELREIGADVVDDHITYWVERLMGMSRALTDVADHRHDPSATPVDAHRYFDLSERVVSAVKDLAKTEGVTPFMAMLAAYLAGMTVWTGREDLTVVSATANRDRLEVQRLIGPFASPLPLRTDLSGNPTFRELVRRVQHVVLDASAHPVRVKRLFDQMPQLAALLPKASQRPNYGLPCDLGFALQLMPIPAADFTGLRLDFVRVDETKAQAGGLVLAIWGPKETPVCEFAYDRALFDEATIERLSRWYPAMLEAIVRDPDIRLRALPLPDERFS